MRNVSTTVLTMKLVTTLEKLNIWFMAKLSVTIIMMFTKLLPMRMVASNRSGERKRASMRLRFISSSMPAICSRVSEKNASSLPELKAEKTRPARATMIATMLPAVGGMKMPVVVVAVSTDDKRHDKGSGSKGILF